MHPEAYRFIAENIGQPASVLELGSLDINGSPRMLAPTADYWGIDVQAGRGVNEIADAAEWRSDRRFDLVICAEVLEHTPLRAEILATAQDHLNPGGRLIITCATHGRAPHSAVDGHDVRPHEYYGNVNLADFLLEVALAGFEPIRFETHHDRGDLYLLAVTTNG
jgi:SAM-dependent methyltransferase